MRLTDLDPRWLIKDGRRVGFVFKSPTRGDDLWCSCFEAPPDRREQCRHRLMEALAATGMALSPTEPSLAASDDGRWRPPPEMVGEVRDLSLSVMPRRPAD